MVTHEIHFAEFNNKGNPNWLVYRQSTSATNYQMPTFYRFHKQNSPFTHLEIY